MSRLGSQEGDHYGEDDSAQDTAPLVGLFAPPDPTPSPMTSSTTAGAGIEEKKSLDESFEDEMPPSNVRGNPASPGSLDHLSQLFARPAPSTIRPESSGPSLPKLERPDIVARQATAPRSNRSDGDSELSPLLATTLDSSIAPPSRDDATPKASPQYRKAYNNNNNSSSSSSSAHVRMPSVAMPAIQESFVQTLDLPPSDKNENHQAPTTSISSTFISCFKNTLQSLTLSTTYIGSFMYLLYHVVFCLALGSAIMRPSSSTSILGLMTKTAAFGTVAASPVYWARLSSEVPALYPTADLFLAPFLAHLALDVDAALANDSTVDKENNDAVFLATFGALTAIGTLLSASLLIAASVFKLANLGSYLPFPVICGFFAAVGIMMWTLAVSIDSGGHKIGAILTSGDVDLVLFALLHHVPTIIVAGFMKWIGPKNPFFVPAIICVTIGLFYLYMEVSGTSLDEMKENGWFWSRDDLVYKSYKPTTMGFGRWAPPAPFGVIRELGLVHWGAVKSGLSNAVALSFLYLIRCSVHGAALKKNVSNLVLKTRTNDPALKKEVDADGVGSPIQNKSHRSRMFSEAVDIEAIMQGPGALGKSTMAVDDSNDKGPKYQLIHAKPTNVTLKEISSTYGWSQIVVVLTGGFPITPSVAASTTMYALGAGGLAPQIGSVMLLLVFYLTDFQIISYIPKPGFSSMLILAAFDMCWTWAYKSWFKMKDKLEWMVVPAIVVCAFTLDLLSAVFLGIAFSTFIFVAAFFRSGVVKYVASGKYIHSTIERPFRMSEWLNDNGNAIQIIVLQNYLFFGNATSVYTYICSSFASKLDGSGPSDGNPSQYLRAKFLILDLTLVTGIDTSTVDVFQDIRNLCQSNQCKLFVAGMSSSLRSILGLGGFKPDGGVRSKRKLRFFASLDAALGKAEDMLLDSDFDDTEQSQPLTLRSGAGGHRRMLSRSDNGFRAALRHIDAEHGDNFSLQLVGLQEYTTLVEVQPGERLYEDGASENMERGLSFIEVGILKLEHNKGATATRGTMGSVRGTHGNPGNLADGETLKLIKDRCLPAAMGGSESRTFRVARIGPGWVVGTLEAVSGMKSPGDTVAVSYCRLHHLEFSKIKEIEEKNPLLVLALYKFLSYLMARRQEATIGQLATLHTIMSSPGNNNWRSLGRSSSNSLNMK